MGKRAVGVICRACNINLCWWSNYVCGACTYKRRKNICQCGLLKDRRSILCKMCRLGTPAHSWNYKGGRTITKQGYVLVLVPLSNGNWKYKPEHRVVMENKLGRRLLAGETVHHKNGDRTDNRLENLELWSRKHTSGQRVTDLLAWAREIIATYETEEQLLLL